MTSQVKRCPKCKSELGSSILVPYWWVCPKCEVLLSPKMKAFPLIGDKQGKKKVEVFNK